MSFPHELESKESTCSVGGWTLVQSLGWEDPPEEGMTTHSSTLAWRTPWTEEPGRLLSMGSQRVGHDWRDLARLPQHLVHLPRTSSFLSVWQTLPPHNASSCGNPFMIFLSFQKPFQIILFFSGIHCTSAIQTVFWFFKHQLFSWCRERQAISSICNLSQWFPTKSSPD